MVNIVVPCVPELSMARIWPEAIQIDRFMDYMPDDWATGHHRRDRAFFYGILATLKRDYVEQLVIDSRAQRDARRAANARRPNLINLPGNVITALTAH